MSIILILCLVCCSGLICRAMCSLVANYFVSHASVCAAVLCLALSVVYAARLFCSEAACGAVLEFSGILWNDFYVFNPLSISIGYCRFANCVKFFINCVYVLVSCNARDQVPQAPGLVSPYLDLNFYYVLWTELRRLVRRSPASVRFFAITCLQVIKFYAIVLCLSAPGTIKVGELSFQR